MLLGGALGLPLGFAVGLSPWVGYGPGIWAPLFVAFGAFMGWAGWWILRQSSDVPKMRAALPLSGPVLASVSCLVLDEPFLVTVPTSILLGWVLGTLLARRHGSA